MHKLHYITYIPSHYIVNNKIEIFHEPPREGQPPKKGQKYRSQSVLSSEVPLYTLVVLTSVYTIQIITFFDKSVWNECSQVVIYFVYGGI